MKQTIWTCLYSKSKGQDFLNIVLASKPRLIQVINGIISQISFKKAMTATLQASVMGISVEQATKAFHQ